MSEKIKEEQVAQVTGQEAVDKHEYVIVGEESYKTESVKTETNSIRFKLADMPITEAVVKFSAVTALKVSGADLQPYGIYENFVFKSATVDAEGAVTLELHIATPEEVRIAKLEQTQTEQDVALADILYGGDE